MAEIGNVEVNIDVSVNLKPVRMIERASAMHELLTIVQEKRDDIPDWLVGRIATLLAYIDHGETGS